MKLESVSFQALVKLSCHIALYGIYSCKTVNECHQQYNTIIYSTRMVRRTAESEARAVARGVRWRGTGLREPGTEKIICLKVPVKKSKR